jgi:hypothetical protein
MISKIRSVVCAIGLVLATLGCSTPAAAEPVGSVGVVVVETLPPTAIVEVIPRAPTVRHVWRGGHWHWTGRSYVWIRGVWVHRPGYHWVAPHWVRHHRGHWHYRPGHWVRR